MVVSKTTLGTNRVTVKFSHGMEMPPGEPGGLAWPYQERTCCSTQGRPVIARTHRPNPEMLSRVSLPLGKAENQRLQFHSISETSGICIRLWESNSAAYPLKPQAFLRSCTAHPVMHNRRQRWREEQRGRTHKLYFDRKSQWENESQCAHRTTGIPF